MRPGSCAASTNDQSNYSALVQSPRRLTFDNGANVALRLVWAESAGDLGDHLSTYICVNLRPPQNGQRKDAEKSIRILCVFCSVAPLRYKQFLSIWIMRICVLFFFWLNNNHLPAFSLLSVRV